MSVSNNIRSIQMGNGFRQVASSGINTKRREFSIVYGGTDWLNVVDFLNGHVFKPFAWTPPDGRVGVFIVVADSVRANPVFKGRIHEVTATFSEQFTSA